MTTPRQPRNGWALLFEEITRQKAEKEGLMTPFQEIQRIEGNLSASTIQRLKSQCSSETEYLEALRREYAAVQQAIARLR